MYIHFNIATCARESSQNKEDPKKRPQQKALYFLNKEKIKLCRIDKTEGLGQG